ARAESPGHCPRAAGCPAGPGHKAQQPRAPWLRCPRDANTVGTASHWPIGHFRRRGTSGPRLLLLVVTYCPPCCPAVSPPPRYLPNRDWHVLSMGTTCKSSHSCGAEGAYQPCLKRAEAL
uniref:RIKEN cDNA A730071L15Rik gene n=1 Tax=Cricetulus griseus TaxID=10029 RepID=A0A8C2N009_CRIGR